jgi:hypothetical protein
MKPALPSQRVERRFGGPGSGTDRIQNKPGYQSSIDK